MKKLGFFSLLLFFVVWSSMGFSQDRLDCSVADEYQRTFKFLLDKKELKISQEYLLSVSAQVAQGCSGAAKRFIHSFETLLKADLDSKSAISLAIDVSQKDEISSAAFLTIFKAAYARDILDLDVYSATTLAKELALAPKKVPLWLESDFLALSRLCSQSGRFPLPINQCPKFVAELIKQALHQEQAFQVSLSQGIAKSFEAGFVHLTEDKKGPQLTSADAMTVLKDLLAISPYAIGEFTKLYQFLSQRNIKPLSRQAAIHEALKLARFTSIKSIETK